MIDKNKIFAGGWNSCGEIDKTIDYINKLKLTEKEFEKLEEHFREIINAYSGMKESAWGEDA